MKRFIKSISKKLTAMRSSKKFTVASYGLAIIGLGLVFVLALYYWNINPIVQWKFYASGSVVALLGILGIFFKRKSDKTPLGEIISEKAPADKSPSEKIPSSKEPAE